MRRFRNKFKIHHFVNVEGLVETILSLVGEYRHFSLKACEAPKIPGEGGRQLLDEVFEEPLENQELLGLFSKITNQISTAVFNCFDEKPSGSGVSSWKPAETHLFLKLEKFPEQNRISNID